MIKTGLIFLLLCFQLSMAAKTCWMDPLIDAPEITVSNITSSSFRVAWGAVSGATKYTVYLAKRDINTGLYLITVTGFDPKEVSSDIRSVDVNNLESSEHYRLSIKAFQGTTASEASVDYVWMLSPAPIVESVTKITSSSFDVSWRQYANGSKNYQIYVSKKEGAVWNLLSGYPKTVAKTLTSSAIAGLEGGSEYKFNMTSLDTNDRTTDKSVDKLILTLPDAPVAKAASNLTANTLTASWSAVTGATGYKFYMKEKVSGSKEYNGTTTTSLLFNASGLESGMQYEYWVTAVNATGESGVSNSITVTTTVLQIPVAIAAGSITGSSFTARWNSVPGASGYLLSVSDGNVWRNYETTNLNYNLTGLQSDFMYQYKVKAKFGSFLSAFSNVIDATTKPDAPVAVVATNITTSSFSANWQVVSGVTGYKLWVISRENTGSNPAGFFPKTVGNVLTFNMTGLNAAHGYQYYVQAVTANGESVVSNAVDVDTKPVAPTAGSATGITASSFTANWSPTTGATGYKLYVWKKSGMQFVSGYNGKMLTATSENLTGLTSETEYQYRISALKNNSESDYSGTINVKTAVQAINQFTIILNASPTEGGTVSGGGTFNQGTSVTAHVAPNNGYDFVNWTEGSTVVSTSVNYIFTLNGNRSLTANFTLKTAISDQKEISGIRIFPNPATDILNISGLKPGAVNSLYGLNSAKIMTRKAAVSLEKIDISGMLKGLYLISVEENDMRFSHKITVR
jgi:uncharacterized repeat protein (TIGR02543 family)